MYTFSQRLLGDVAQVRAAIGHEPAIRPDFSKADVTTIVRVIFALMMNGVSSAAGLFRYLSNRGCHFDRETIDFLLLTFEGDDPDRHLWSRMNLGDYAPQLAAMRY